MRRIIPMLVCLLGLSACASSSTVITGVVTEAIDVSKVGIFYQTPPACEFDVVALIDIPGEYLSRASLLDAFRHKAASVGATAVQVIDLQQTGTVGYRGSARALRCTS